MLYAILGDIHGNIHALRAVLDDAERAGAERFLCLGDVVGYGAHPSECISVVRELGALTVAGNHDWGAIGKVDVRYFNADARDSIDWTRRQLSNEECEHLDNLELVATADDVTIVHSSLFAPDYFDYINTLYDVHLNFKHLSTRICFVGHSHVPVMFLDTEPAAVFLEPEYKVPEDRRLVVNVGSVGQPRDHLNLASYALYDSDERKVSMRRVDYDCQSASQDILDAGLPPTNATRILIGR